MSDTPIYENTVLDLVHRYLFAPDTDAQTHGQPFCRCGAVAAKNATREYGERWHEAHLAAVKISMRGEL